MKVAQSCQTICNPMDYTVHGILQARILGWVTFPFSKGSSQPRDWTQISCVAGGFFTTWATREALRTIDLNSIIWGIIIGQCGQIYPTGEYMCVTVHSYIYVYNFGCHVNYRKISYTFTVSWCSQSKMSITSFIDLRSFYSSGWAHFLDPWFHFLTQLRKRILRKDIINY